MYQFISYWIQDSLGRSFFTVCSADILEEPRETLKRFFPRLDVSRENENLRLTNFYIASEPMQNEEIYSGDISNLSEYK